MSKMTGPEPHRILAEYKSAAIPRGRFSFGAMYWISRVKCKRVTHMWFLLLLAPYQEAELSFSGTSNMQLRVAVHSACRAKVVPKSNILTPHLAHTALTPQSFITPQYIQIWYLA